MQIFNLFVVEKGVVIRHLELVTLPPASLVLESQIEAAMPT